jgi:hypothetical protein
MIRRLPRWLARGHKPALRGGGDELSGDDIEALLYPGFTRVLVEINEFNQHSMDFQTREPTDVPENPVTGSGVCK